MSEIDNQKPSDNPELTPQGGNVSENNTSESNTSEVSSTEQPGQEGVSVKLGDYLRRAREAQKLELSQLARENRMTDSMLQAIEQGNYEELPGDTYIRAYLKSIAHRLHLEETKIIDWYLKETHQVKPNELDQVIQIKNNEDYDKPTLQKGKLILLAVVLVLLFIGAQIFKVLNDQELKNSQLEPKAQKSSEISPGSQLNNSVKDSSSSKDSSATSLASADSLIKQDSVNAKDLALKSDSLRKADSLQVQAAVETALKQPKTLLQISAIKDSTWIAVKAKGFKDYARVIRKGQKPKYLTRRDTVVLEVGDPKLVKLQLNAQLTKIDTTLIKIYDGKLIP